MDSEPVGGAEGGGDRVLADRRGGAKGGGEQRRIDGDIELRIGSHTIAGRVRADSGGDRVLGLVRWVEFAIGRSDRAALRDRDQPLTLFIGVGNETFESEPLSAAMRSSLLADLETHKS